MDQRQKQIQVGAGLQESRLNTDLIQWLEKYSSWILGVLLVVVAAYFGWTRWQQHVALQVDQAFAEYSAARGDTGRDSVLTGSPDNLLAIASQYDGRGSVWELATLDAASIYLGCARRGLRPGADIIYPTAEDVLSPQETSEFLQKARDLFASVADRAQRARGKTPLQLRALLGLASAATSLGDVDRARSALEQLIAVADAENFGSQAAEARERLAELPRYAAEPRLYADAELPAPPEPPAGPPLPETLVPMPEGWAPPGFTPELEAAAQNAPSVVPQQTPADPAPAEGEQPEQR